MGRFPSRPYPKSRALETGLLPSCLGSSCFRHRVALFGTGTGRTTLRKTHQYLVRRPQPLRFGVIMRAVLATFLAFSGPASSVRFISPQSPSLGTTADFGANLVYAYGSAIEAA
ncbi:hypothetical protein N657DRAFT_55019 [Parathielavia appendiculata]|uniref:Uncharacterized protein n=1 Tax=Parathielavia appendiculata TaxID=2587402 RepID=A0AAN6Z932_9PEZI|nr:hypothetical protein N657DRAFT_55019 [Parathielavia appendiculata]